MYFFYRFNIRLSYFTFINFLYPCSELSRQTNDCKKNRHRVPWYRTFLLWNFSLLWTTFWTVIYSWKQTFFSNKNDPKRSIRVSSLHRIPFMVKAYFCRPISFARKPNDWVKSKIRTKIFSQRMTRSSCTCVKLTCRRQQFNRLEYVLAVFYIKNTIVTPHKMLKCFFRHSHLWFRLSQ